MNLEQFEKICTESRMRILPKRFTRHANIVIAEKLIHDNGKPEWEILWGLERDTPDVAHVLKMDAWRTTDGGAYMVTEQQRVEAVLKDADQFIADSLAVGRYA